MADQALIIRELRYAYGHIQALAGVDFEVGNGKIVTLIGNNGAGKSTTLNAICGIFPTVSGQISSRGRQLVGLSSDQIIRMGIIQVPEGRRIFPQLTVEENLLMGAFVRKRSGLTADLGRVYALFPILRERKKLSGGSLSGGEQQMLAIGRGLMARPSVLLLDEPSLGLAPMIVKEVFAVIRDINASGTTLLLVEQNARLALQTAADGYVMEKGRIVLRGTGEELLRNVDVRKVYLGENLEN